MGKIINYDDIFEEAEICMHEKNYKKAFELFKKCALNGDLIAQHNLGYLYLVGLGTQQDINESIKWYLKSTKQKNPQAYKELALIYETEAFGVKDDKKWFEYMKKSADLGDCEAINKLGMYYMMDKDDDKEAYKYFKMGADKGDPYSIYGLGDVTLRSNDDDATHRIALEYYEQAGLRDIVEAQFKAGIMYYENMGISKNTSDFPELCHLRGDDKLDRYIIAVYWLEKAFKNGSFHALVLLNDIKKELFGEGLFESHEKIKEDKLPVMMMPPGYDDEYVMVRKDMFNKNFIPQGNAFDDEFFKGAISNTNDSDENEDSDMTAKFMNQGMSLEEAEDMRILGSGFNAIENDFDYDEEEDEEYMRLLKEMEEKNKKQIEKKTKNNEKGKKTKKSNN